MGRRVRAVSSLSIDLSPHFMCHEVNSLIRNNALWNAKMVNRMTWFVVTNAPLSPVVCHCPIGLWMMWSQWPHRLPPSRSTWLWPLQSAQLPAAENSMVPFLRVISQLPFGRLITLDYFHHGRGRVLLFLEMAVPSLHAVVTLKLSSWTTMLRRTLSNILWRNIQALKNSYNSLNQYFLWPEI